MERLHPPIDSHMERSMCHMKASRHRIRTDIHFDDDLASISTLIKALNVHGDGGSNISYEGRVVVWFDAMPCGIIHCDGDVDHHFYEPMIHGSLPRENSA